MAKLKGTPQPKGWHPQKATEKWIAYKQAADQLANRSVAERERRDREERAKTKYSQAAKAKEKG